MLVPAMGFLLGVIGFGTIGLVVLSVSGRRRVVPLLVFIAAAFAGALAWSFVVSRVFGTLNSSALVIIFLAGLPLSGGLTGWAATRRFTRVV
jgi:hypothetical protein